jgi:hypothetical protein
MRAFSAPWAMSTIRTTADLETEFHARVARTEVSQQTVAVGHERPIRDGGAMSAFTRQRQNRCGA